MRKLLILIPILFAGYISVAQPEKKDNNRLKSANKPADTSEIVFDGINGKPLRIYNYVKYKDWVNISFNNVNPLNDSMTANIKSVNLSSGIFTPFSETDFSNAASSANITASETHKVVTKINKSQLDSINLFDAKIQMNTLTQETAKKLTEAEELKKKIIELELKNDTLIIKNKLLEKKLKNTKNELRKKEQEIADLTTKIKSLEVKVKALEQQPEWRSQFKTDYAKFINVWNQIGALNNLHNDLKEIMQKSFMEKDNAKSYIQQLLRACNITTLSNDTAIIEKIRIKSSELLNSVDKLQTNLQLLYNKINEGKLVESFNVSGELTSVDKKQKMKINKLDVQIQREPMFKEQIQIINKKADLFKNDSTRNAFFTATTKTSIVIQDILNSDFTKSVVTFQLNSDEAEVELTHKLIKPFTITAKKRLKVEVGNGLFIHAGATGEEYQEFIDSSKNRYLSAKSKPGAIISWGPVIYFYRNRPDHLFNWGGSVGINFPLNDDAGNIQVTGGLGFKFNTIDRLGFSIGASMKRLQVLNTGNLIKINNDSGSYTFKNQAEKPEYDKVFKIGFYFGISYNFATLIGKDKATQTVSN